MAAQRAHARTSYTREQTNRAVENWNAVEYVAKHLLKLGSIPGEPLRTLIGNAPGRGKHPRTMTECLAGRELEILAGLAR